MTVSLYDLSVASYLQTLGGVAGFLEKGREHCEQNGMAPGDLVESRLYSDMAPLRFQIVSVAHHSLGAIDGLRAGVFRPPSMESDHDYPALQSLVADTRDALEQLDPDAVNALVGGDMRFEMGDLKVPFTAENFILSFSLPNFYFHATTAYDILRMNGVPLGKRDFTGKLRIKRS